jgi:hypothetical protein
VKFPQLYPDQLVAFQVKAPVSDKINSDLKEFWNTLLRKGDVAYENCQVILGMVKATSLNRIRSSIK